jgi:adenylylsulfate kinase
VNNIHPIDDRLISRKEQELLLNQKGMVLWFTGLSGSGKSTIAEGVQKRLYNQGYLVKVLDGDNVRAGINNNLGFSLEDRKENIRRIAEVAKLFLDTGIIVLCSFVSPTIEIREQAKKIIGKRDFYEIYVDTSIEECERRDVKGLYKKARNGEIKGFTGIDSPYEHPVSPALILDTGNQNINKCVNLVLMLIQKQIKI